MYFLFIPTECSRAKGGSGGDEGLKVSMDILEVPSPRDPLPSSSTVLLLRGGSASGVDVRRVGNNTEGVDRPVETRARG